MGKPTLAQIMNLAASAPHNKSNDEDPVHNIHGDRFRRQGRAWFCNTGLPSDITVEVDGMAFHLHKFPLTSRSGRFAKLVADQSTHLAPVSADPPAAASPPSASSVSAPPCPVFRLPNLPGGAASFETVAKFCYSLSVEISAANVAALRCAADYLEMTEEYGECNLVVLTEGFLKQAVATSWKASVTALKSCETLLPTAEELSVVRKCVDSIVVKLACCRTDPAAGSAVDVSPIRVNDSASVASTATPMSAAADHRRSMQSPDGTLLWNGISTGAKPKRAAAEGGGSGGGWCEDLTVLSLPFFKKLIVAMEEKGIRADTIAAAVVHYAEKFIPGLRHHRSLRGYGRASGGDAGQKARGSGYGVVPALTKPVAADLCSANGAAADASSDQQLILLETIESLLPSSASCRQSSTTEMAVSAKFLLSMLKVSLILDAGSDTKSRLEQRIGHQLHRASVDDLLIPNYSYGSDTLYDVDCMQRLINHFLSSSEAAAGDSPGAPPPNSADFDGESIAAAAAGASETYRNHLTDADSSRHTSPLCSVMSSGTEGVAGAQLRAVAKLLDEYLAEIASDPNLEPAKFQALAQALPHSARESDDGLYRAIDIFVKNHGWMKEREREEVCSIMDCAKLTVEACAHAAQNEKMPLRVVVQVLFMEQMQLRDAIMMGGAARATLLPPPPAGVDAAPSPSKFPSAAASPHHQDLAIHLDMASLRRRVAELERECHRLRRRLRCRPSRWAAGLSSKLSCRDVADAAAPRQVAPESPPPLQQPLGRRSYSSSSSSPRPSFSNNSSPCPFTIKHTLKL